MRKADEPQGSGSRGKPRHGRGDNDPGDRAVTKKVNVAPRLADAAVEILSNPTPTDRDRAFMARQLVQATLPHRDPGKVEAWQRTHKVYLMTQSLQSFVIKA